MDYSCNVDRLSSALFLNLSQLISSKQCDDINYSLNFFEIDCRHMCHMHMQIYIYLVHHIIYIYIYIYKMYLMANFVSFHLDKGPPLCSRFILVA